MALVGTGSAVGYYNTNVPFTDVVGTIFFQFKPRKTATGTRNLVNLAQAAGQERLCVVHNDATNEAILQTTNSSGVVVGTAICGSQVNSAWINFCGVTRSSTSRQLSVGSLPGEASSSAPNRITTEAAAFSPSAWDQFSIGYLKSNGADSNGMISGSKIANVFFWDYGLELAQASALVSGHVHPMELNGPRPIRWFPLDESGICTLTGLQLTAQGQPQHDKDMPELRARAKLFVVPALKSGVVPTISSTNNSNTLIDESTFIITGTGLTSATAVTFKQTDRPDYNATAFITANDSTTVTLTGLDVQDMSMKYGAATVEVTTAGGTSTPFAITIDKQAGHAYITLSGLDSGVEWLDLTSVDGDQRLAATTTAKGGTFAFVGVDGNYTITYPGDAPVNDSIYFAEFDDSADQWYESTVGLNEEDGSGLTLTLVLRT